eukprot:4523962-Pleurochrysis_carterae.AAC.1
MDRHTKYDTVLPIPPLLSYPCLFPRLPQMPETIGLSSPSPSGLGCALYAASVRTIPWRVPCS